MEPNVTDNFRKWWYEEDGSVKYAEMMDSGIPMLNIIEKIFDAGQMAGIDAAQKVIRKD